MLAFSSSKKVLSKKKKSSSKKVHKNSTDPGRTGSIRGEPNWAVQVLADSLDSASRSDPVPVFVLQTRIRFVIFNS